MTTDGPVSIYFLGNEINHEYDFFFNYNKGKIIF